MAHSRGSAIYNYYYNRVPCFESHSGLQDEMLKRVKLRGESREM